MKCNQCGNHMVKGYMPTKHLKIMWLPEELEIPWFGFKAPKGAVALTYHPLLGPEKAISYRCLQCNIIVAPIPDLKK